MDLTTLQSKTRFLTNTTSDDYSDTNLTRALNDYYHRLFAIIMQVMGEWEVNGDYATTSLVNGQEEYVLNTSYIQLKRVEVNYTGGTNTWQKATLLDMSEVDVAFSNSTEVFHKASPFVRVMDNSLFLEPAPDANVTGGLKIFFTKDFTELSSSSDEPVTPEFSHIYLCHGAGLDYSVSKTLRDKINIFSNFLAEDELKIKDYYSKRLPARRKQVRRKPNNFK